MLQIVTGKYFRPVELYETLHRRSLFTNYATFKGMVWDIPVGQLRFSTSWGLKTITAEIQEKLEAVHPDGTKEALISTAGEELISDVADILSFALNVICTPRHDLAQRLIIPEGTEEHAPRRRNRQLRRTFDSMVVAKEGDEALVNDLINKLTSLDRKTYETFMRAIKRCVVATHRVGDDISLAYTLLVAALESLAGAVEPRLAEWTDYEEAKRRRIDTALANASPEIADAIRAAILQNEHTALRRRYVDFVLGNIGLSYYREEATECQRPVCEADLQMALNESYAIRSRTMHQLRELAPETHSLGDVAETSWIDGKTIFTLEGLHRLTRHVILEALRKAEPKDEETFDYRSALPGIVRMRLHSQYWVWQTDGFTPDQAGGRFQGFLDLLLPVMAREPEAQLTDIRPLLELYETLIPGASPEHRLSMLGLYFLWHLFTGRDHRLPNADMLMKKYESAMLAPGIVALVLHILSQKPLEWSTDELLAVEAGYWEQRRKGRGLHLPAQLEASIAITVAERLEVEGNMDGALAAAARAVGAMPGVPRILEYEAALQSGSTVPYTILGLVLDKKREPEESDAIEAEIPNEEESTPQSPESDA